MLKTQICVTRPQCVKVIRNLLSVTLLTGVREQNGVGWNLHLAHGLDSGRERNLGVRHVTFGIEVGRIRSFIFCVKTIV